VTMVTVFRVFVFIKANILTAVFAEDTHSTDLIYPRCKEKKRGSTRCCDGRKSTQHWDVEYFVFRVSLFGAHRLGAANLMSLNIMCLMMLWKSSLHPRTRGEPPCNGNLCIKIKLPALKESNMKKNNRKNRKIQNQPKSRIPHPPALASYEVRHSTVLRFDANAAFSTNITYQNLLDLICVATTAAAPYNLFEMVKVRKVEMWASGGLGVNISVSCCFIGAAVGVTGDQALHTDTAMSIEPAHISCRPSARSQASLFQTSGNNIAFVINGVQGTVIDVHLSYRGGTNGAAQNAQNVSIGAPVGSTIFRGLDGLAVATSKFGLPVGVIQF